MSAILKLRMTHALDHVNRQKMGHMVIAIGILKSIAAYVMLRHSCMRCY